MTKDTGAAFLVAAVVVALVWYNTRYPFKGAAKDMPENAGEIVPEATPSNLPNGSDMWQTPYYLRANYPSNRDLGSPVVPSVVEAHLRGSVMSQEQPPQI